MSTSESHAVKLDVNIPLQPKQQRGTGPLGSSHAYPESAVSRLKPASLHVLLLDRIDNAAPNLAPAIDDTLYTVTARFGTLGIIAEPADQLFSDAIRYGFQPIHAALRNIVAQQ